MTARVAAFVAASQITAASTYLRTKYPTSAGAGPLPAFLGKYCEVSTGPVVFQGLEGVFPDVAEDGSGATRDQVFGALATYGGGWGYVGSNPQGGQFWASLTDLMANGMQGGPYVPYAPADEV